MSSWQTTRIEDIAADARSSIAIGPFGSRMKSDCYSSTGVPVIRGTNISDGRCLAGQFVFVSAEMADSMPACNVFAGDLVFPHRGSIGEVGIVPEGGEERYMLSTSLMKLSVDRQRVNPLYVYYFFKSQKGRHELLKNASQVGTPGIATPLTSLKQIEIPVPPLPEQRAIASVLGSLDDKIELNRRMNRTLEQMAAAIFKAWFVDFEPVRAKAAGAASFPGMPQPAFDALPTTFTDSELGPIPEGWEAKRLPDIIEVNPKRSLKKGEPAPHLDMKNMPTQGHAPETWGDRPFGSGMKFINGDTLVARITPCLENGKTAFVDFLDDGAVGWGSTEYIVLRPRPQLPEVFAYCLARTNEFRDFAIQNMTGTSGRQRVPATAMGHYPLVQPDQNTAECFGKAVEPLFALIRSNMDESRSLAESRDVLLPQLLAGKVRAFAGEDVECH